MDKTKIKLPRLLLISLLLIMCTTLHIVDSYAASTPVKITLVSPRTAYFNKLTDYYGNTTINPTTVSVDFTTTESMIFTIPIKADVLGDSSTYITGGLRVQLRNEQGTLIQNDYFDMNGYEDGGWIDDWLYSDNYFQSPGKYTYTLIYSGNENLRVNFAVYGHTGIAQKANMKKSVSKAGDNWVKIGQISPGFPEYKESSSKKSVVPYTEVDEDGTVYAYCKRKGTCKVTIKLPSGKKYVTKVKVKAGLPNFDAELVDYNTRGNYFIAKVYNYGNSPLTVMRKGAKVLEDDYKSFDRKIKSQKAVTVKPGKTKNIKFKVSGRVTWYNSDDFIMYTYVKYEGKKYKVKFWYDESYYKRGGSWYESSY